jgi:peptidoglycan hydrolase CwlO-like protein
VSDAGTWTGVLIGGVAVVVSFLAYRLSRRAAREEESAAGKAVDAQAYDRARLLYESSITQMERETGRVQSQVTALRAEIQGLHEQADMQQTEIRNQRAEIRTLRDDNRRLKAELAELRDGTTPP